MIVSRVLHAGYIFESQGTRVLFDPVFESPFSVNCYAFPAVSFGTPPAVDAIFISHYHDDHCSFDSLAQLDRLTPIYMFCVHEEMFALLRELDFTCVKSIALDRAIRVGGFEIIARRALDEDVDSIFEIHADGASVLNVVDSWIPPRTMDQLRGRKWDLVLWPFQTMRELECLSLAPSAAAAAPEFPPEWLEQIEELAPRAVVPSSCQFRFEEWSWLNTAFFPISYKRFAREMRGRRVERLEPGQSIDLPSLERVPNLSWVTQTEPSRDYEFDPRPVTTQEIATHFETRLWDAIENFFAGEETGGWRVHVFARDEVREFAMRGEGRTEIPQAKLYGAIVDGESLTSLYVKTSAEDPSDDPLLAKLYNGKFASYQKAQLLRLREKRRKP